MREWLEKHGGYWTFGLFLLALLGAMGGVGVWGLNAEVAKQDAKVESVSTFVRKVSAVADADIRRVEEKVEGEVKRLDNRADTGIELIGQINARLDRMDDRFDRMDAKLNRVDGKLNRMDGKLDTLLMGMSAPAAK